MDNGLDRAATAQTEARYNRIARVYDFVKVMSERRFKPEGKTMESGWRQHYGSWRRHRQEFPIPPPRREGDQMLLRARERAHRLGKPIDLREGDVQAPDFPDNTFDTAAATFVFRTVPDPRAARVESSGQAGGARFCCSTACALNARSLGR